MIGIVIAIGLHIVVAVAAAVVWRSSFYHLVRGCHCTREVRWCSLLPAGVVKKIVIIPNEGDGGG